MSSRVYPADAVAGAPSNTGRALRQTAVAPFVAMGSAARPLGAKSGVRVGTPSSIVSATATTWTVTPFAGVIDGEALAIAGPYTYSFDTNQTGSVTAAGASARVDRLDVQVADPAESDGSSVPGAQIVYTAGGPGLAAAPARSHTLAQINVPISGGGLPTVSWAPAWSSDSGEWQFNTYAELTAYTTLIGSTNVPPQQQSVVIADTTTANNGAYAWSGSVWVRMLAGANMIAPVSVVGGTVTPNGAVSFTAATAVSLNGLLTSAFDVYEVVVSLTASSAADNLAFRLRAAGADYSGGGHNTTVKEVAAGAAQTIAYTPNNTLAPIGRTNGADGTDVTFRIYSPAIAANLKRYGVCHPTYDGSATERVASGYINSRVAYDGITLLCAAGATMTGKARVYGIYNG